jgi:hypothetical protein
MMFVRVCNAKVGDSEAENLLSLHPFPWDCARYLRIERCNVDTHRELVSFWRARGALIYDVVAPYLFFPTSAAVVERSFSLATLVDTKNRQKTSPGLRQMAIMMYCNGAVEARFTNNGL